MEEAFWEDNATRELLFTIDSCVWPMAVMSILFSMTSIYRLVQPGAQLVLGFIMGTIALTTGMTAVAMKWDLEGYYKHRGKLMALNRLGRIVYFAVVMLFMDVDLMVQYVDWRLARGAHPLLVLKSLLGKGVGNHQIWGFLFPMAVGQGIWLDILQQGMRLVVMVMYCVRLIQGPVLRPVAVSVCIDLNMVLNTDMLPTLGTPFLPVALLDARCVEDGPLLLALFSWWYGGCFWPTFTVWYIEGLLKKRFVRQWGGNAGEFAGWWATIRDYVLVNVIVACVSWPLLQQLLAHGSNRDLLVRTLLSSPWGHLAQNHSTSFNPSENGCPADGGGCAL